MSLPTDTKGKAASADVMKVEAGQTEILIVGSAATGYEYWRAQGGPVRQADVFDEPLPDDAQMEDIKDKAGNVVGSQKKKQTFYWAIPVYNFKTDSFIIWQVTQKGLREELIGFQGNKSWGDPTGNYTITIDKSGTGFQTKNKLVANPANEERKAELAAIMERYNANPIDVAADLFGTAEAS